MISKHDCLLNGSRRQLLKNGLLSGTRISVSIQDHVIPADLWSSVDPSKLHKDVSFSCDSLSGAAGLDKDNGCW